MDVLLNKKNQGVQKMFGKFNFIIKIKDGAGNNMAYSVIDDNTWSAIERCVKRYREHFPDHLLNIEIKVNSYITNDVVAFEES